MVQTGLERLIADPHAWIRGQRLGLLCNPASTDRNFRHASELIHEAFPGQLKALYSPQHGFFAEKQDNMIASEDTADSALRIPIFSLYGQTRIPTAEMFAPIDTLIIDLQDAGTRVYTFIYTASYCLEAAKRFGKKVLVTDRPNPLGGLRAEGNCLHPDYASFVGRFPLPMRHGLTIAEIMKLFNEFYGIGSDLEIIPMSGWRRAMYFRDTGLPWIAPSPNLPTPESAAVYPGQVLWEGTNISEGRGTTQPFEIFGAPFLDTDSVLSLLGADRIPGAILRPLRYEPTSNKWKGCLCRGFQIHVTDRNHYRPYIGSLRLLEIIRFLHRDLFEWKSPPYEYEFEKLPIDLIIGNAEIRRRLENFDDIEEIEASWRDELEAFAETSRKFHLYSEK